MMYYMSGVIESQGTGYTRVFMIGSFIDEYSAMNAFQKTFNCQEFPSFHEKDEFLEMFKIYIPHIIRNALNPDYQKDYGNGFTFTMSFHV